MSSKENKMNTAKETERMRKERLAGSNNGSTMRTRTVKSKKEKNSSREVIKRNFQKEVEKFLK